MKKIILLIIIAGLAFSQQMIVRVYTTWGGLRAISDQPLDIASAHADEWYDIVADRQTMDKIIGSGLPYEIKVYSLEYEKERVRGGYHSYDQYNQLMRQMATNYPSICKFDSLPIRTYQGRWIYGVKISDNPNFEDPNEPGFLIDGTHHAREWATPDLVYHFCDSITKVYNTNNEIQQIVDNVELYCFPIINVDGYVYDYSGGGLSWRKNREPFGGATGTDCNRNYGSCANILKGDWGAVDSSKASHSPSNIVMCGAYMNSGDETRALTMYIRNHIINTYMSYHSYGEYFMWGWGFTRAGTPDATVYSRFGNRMAGMINRLGGGTYLPGQVPVILYAVSGASIDWVYSWNHWLNGIANLSYTTEIGTSFYQPTADLDIIIRENFKALKYLAQLCRDSIGPLCEGVVPPPGLYPIGNVSSNFTVAWHALNPSENHPTRWELVELSNPSIKTDSLESGTGRWTLNGFTWVTTQSHSPTYSLFSGNASNMNNAVNTIHPYLVQTGDSFSFWCYYNLQSDADVAVAEVSENGREWFNLDTMRFTGTQTIWTRRAYSLASWVGKSVYFRFRTMSDGTTNNGGFYVDDIRPTCLFANVTSISNNILDTLYNFTGHAMGTYYYYVRGNNTTWGWGDYSCLQRANVIVGISESQTPVSTSGTPYISLSPNPFSKALDIRYSIGQRAQNIELKIYDVSGRLVRKWDHQTVRLSDYVNWDGTDDYGYALPAGIYFIQFTAGDYKRIEKTVLLR